jgi:hypothetical protein
MSLGLHQYSISLYTRGDLDERLGGRTVLHRAAPLIHPAVARALEDLRLRIPRDETAEMRAPRVERGNVRFPSFHEEDRPPFDGGPIAI